MPGNFPSLFFVADKYFRREQKKTFIKAQGATDGWMGGWVFVGEVE